MAGRPPEYTRELSDVICEMIADGRSMLAISQMAGMPGRTTVKRWVSGDLDGFAERYLEAKTQRIHQMVEDTIDIADGIDGAEGAELDPANKKIRIDARRWVAARMNRGMYGDHIAHDVKTTTAAGASDADLIAIAFASGKSDASSPEGEG